MKKHKILVIRYRFVGDTILTIPFLRNLRNNYPDSQIDMLVAPVSGEVIANCPYVDNFIYFDTTKKHRYENSEKQEKKNFFYYVKMLRKEKYDKTYVLKRSLSSALLAFLAGIPKRVGFDTEGRGLLLTQKVKYIENRHEVDCFLDVLEADGLKVYDRYLENWIDESLKQQMMAKLPSDREIALVHATSGNVNKEWSEENFSQIIEYLSNEKNLIPVFLGTKKDNEKYERILLHIKSELVNKPISFCGQFDLIESLAMTSCAKIMVGCDSGNLHMAASLNIPVVGIYGPMNYKKWYALGGNCQILHANLQCMPCGLKKPCPIEHKCLKDINVEQVKDAIDKII